MFYGHEVLTDRKYGVATIWLVATLGSKSNLKKVTRRAILDVDLPKACQTITKPEAPLALRLQGSLLYGVSRVYSQQCGYVLADVTSLRDRMRGTELVLKQMDLDPEIGNAKPEQLNLADDPGFIPDFDLSFDLSVFGLLSDESSAADSLSLRTIASSQTSLQIDEEEEDEPGLIITSYDTPGGGFGGLDLPSAVVSSSIVGTGSEAGQMPSALDNEPAVTENVVFDVDEDGALRQRDDIIFQESGHGYHTISEPDINGGHGTEPQDVVENNDQLQQHLGFDNDIPMFEDDNLASQTVEEASPHQDDITGLPTTSQPASDIHPTDENSETAEAPQRRARPHKSIKPDQRTELGNRDLNEWSQNYRANMRATSRLKEQQGSRFQAKKYAELWSVGQGIGRVAFAFGHDNSTHPLAIFSGQSLWEMLKGPGSPNGTKRARPSSEGGDSEEEARRVKARTISKEDIARVVEGDDFMFADDDGLAAQKEDVNIESEVGRHAPPSLQDHSSGMPWNLSASRPSSVQPLGSGMLARLSSSVGGIPGNVELGPPSALGRRTSRLTSASPLLGRGLSRLWSQELLDPSRLTSNDDEFADLDQQLGAGIDVDYELYGPSATVDTQIAAQSQWVTTTLENEAYNFLTFVSASITERRGQQGLEEAGDDATRDSITFNELLPPAHNSQVVGAQGLLHVLALATKGLLEVYQEEQFGEIEMAIAGN